jgi:hypothetical protein
VATTPCHIHLHHMCCLCLTQKHLTQGISNLVSLIIKIKLGLSVAWPDTDTASGHFDRRVRSARQQQQLVSNDYFVLGTLINTYWPALGDLSWTFSHSNILLSWAHSLPLISLACLTNQSEFEWFQVHLLMSLHLVGTWVSIGCRILVTLGGCRHLDSLETAEELWQ